MTTWVYEDEDGLQVTETPPRHLFLQAIDRGFESAEQEEIHDTATQLEQLAHPGNGWNPEIAVQLIEKLQLLALALSMDECPGASPF